MDLRHFRLLRVVGKGSFGRVRIVEHKTTGKFYALKYINKEKCVEKKAVDNIIRERNLLEHLEYYPFLVNLRYAFQDDRNLFMVLDLMLGGDLRFHLDYSASSITEESIKFWMAELCLGIHYMHTKNIVHRDLKPDNLLLDDDGHVHIADFNVTAYLPKNGEYLKSISGTVSYMAPEMVKKTGYREQVDWWSLGVIMYELMFGKRPFRGSTRSEILRAIERGRYKIPIQSYSLDCVSFLKGLLQPSPRKRLGSLERGGFDSLRRHPFFNGLDWTALERLEISSPFKPDKTRINFDATHELEEVLEISRSEKLKYRKRSLIDRELLSPSYLKMEDDYADFNTDPKNPVVFKSSTLISELSDSILQSYEDVEKSQDSHVPSTTSQIDMDLSRSRPLTTHLELSRRITGNSSILQEEVVDVSDQEFWKSVELQGQDEMIYPFHDKRHNRDRSHSIKEFGSRQLDTFASESGPGIPLPHRNSDSIHNRKVKHSNSEIICKDRYKNVLKSSSSTYGTDIELDSVDMKRRSRSKSRQSKILLQNHEPLTRYHESHKDQSRNTSNQNTTHNTSKSHGNDNENTKSFSQDKHHNSNSSYRSGLTRILRFSSATAPVGCHLNKSKSKYRVHYSRYGPLQIVSCQNMINARSVSLPLYIQSDAQTIAISTIEPSKISTRYDTIDTDQEYPESIDHYIADMRSYDANNGDILKGIEDLELNISPKKIKSDQESLWGKRHYSWANDKNAHYNQFPSDECELDSLYDDVLQENPPSPKINVDEWMNRSSHASSSLFDSSKERIKTRSNSEKNNSKTLDKNETKKLQYRQ